MCPLPPGVPCASPGDGAQALVPKELKPADHALLGQGWCPAHLPSSHPIPFPAPSSIPACRPCIRTRGGGTAARGPPAPRHRGSRNRGLWPPEAPPQRRTCGPGQVMGGWRGEVSGSQNDFPASTCFAHGTRSRERGGRSVHAARPQLSALTCITQPGPFWRRVHRVGRSPPPVLRSWSLRPAGWCGDPSLVDTAFYAVSGRGAGRGLGRKASTWHECLLLSKRIRVPPGRDAGVGAQHTDGLSSACRWWHCQCYASCGRPAGCTL